MNIIKKMKDENTPGLSIAYFEHGTLESTNCFGVTDNETKEEVTCRSIFHACSMTKLLTAICVLKLHQDNHINIFDDVNKYLKSWKLKTSDSLKSTRITVADLLAHQGGVIDSNGSFEPVLDGQLPKNIEILQGSTVYNNQAVHVSYAPGTRFEYSDGGYAVLELLIEEVTGISYVDFVTKHIFHPLDLQDTFVWTSENKAKTCVAGHDKYGKIIKGRRPVYPNIGGAGMWTTPGNFSIILIDLLKSYNHKSGVLINKETAKLMFKSYGCVDFVGLGVFLGLVDGKPYFMSQGWGLGMQCQALAYLNEETGGVVMMNSEPGKHQSESIVGMVLREILNITY
jgi:CubicO group peptidase (beta-lactamase class C family)